MEGWGDNLFKIVFKTFTVLKTLTVVNVLQQQISCWLRRGGKRPSLHANLLLSYKPWLLARQVCLNSFQEGGNFLLREDNIYECVHLYACDILVVPALPFKLLKECLKNKVFYCVVFYTFRKKSRLNHQTTSRI